MKSAISDAEPEANARGPILITAMNFGVDLEALYRQALKMCTSESYLYPLVDHIFSAWSFSWTRDSGVPGTRASVCRPQVVFRTRGKNGHNITRVPDMANIIIVFYWQDGDPQSDLLFWVEVKALKKSTCWTQLTTKSDYRLSSVLKQVEEQLQVAMSQYPACHIFFVFVIVGPYFLFIKYARPGAPAADYLPSFSSETMPVLTSSSTAGLTRQILCHTENILSASLRELTPVFLDALKLTSSVGLKGFCQQDCFLRCSTADDYNSLRDAVKLVLETTIKPTVQTRAMKKVAAGLTEG